MDVPLYVKDEFGPFYKATFETRGRAAGHARPCSSNMPGAWAIAIPARPSRMANDELKELGAHWVGNGSWSPAYITRLHVRYDAKSFPEDIAFEETADQSSYQARYVLRHPFTGEVKCPAGQAYRASLPAAFAEQADTLISMTGWPRKEVEERMALTGQPLTRK